MSSLISPEDAPVLAGALGTETDFLITLDRKDFMNKKLQQEKLATTIVTPQEFFQQYWR